MHTMVCCNTKHTCLLMSIMLIVHILNAPLIYIAIQSKLNCVNMINYNKLSNYVKCAVVTSDVITTECKNTCLINPCSTCYKSKWSVVINGTQTEIMDVGENRLHVNA